MRLAMVQHLCNFRLTEYFFSVLQLLGFSAPKSCNPSFNSFRLLKMQLVTLAVIILSVRFGAHSLSECHTCGSFMSGNCNVGGAGAGAGAGAGSGSGHGPGRRIVDISHAYREDMPVADSPEGLGSPLKLIASMKNGSDYNFSEMKMGVHSGTHVDSPGHFYQEYYEAGLDVDTLDLDILNGPALLVDVPRDTNITAKVMEALNIPRGIQRVLFRTLNTDRRLMWKREFDSSFVGFMKDGAQWLLDNTNINLVGIDYLSAAAYVHAAPAHLVFLKNKDIILVEGLKLDDVEVGIYSLHCLPLRLLGAEGSPTRCILIR